MSNRLFSQKVSDLHSLSTVLNDTVDGEMGIYKTHLVLEALCDTGDHVLDERLDRS